MSTISSVIPLQSIEIYDYVVPLSSSDDKQHVYQTYSSEHYNSMKHVLSKDKNIIFDKALVEMLTRRYYLIEHEFRSSDRFEGWIYTYNRHRYKIIISYDLSCSCKKFKKYNVCKHFLFVLKRIFNVNLYSMSLRLSIMEYRQLKNIDLENIFQGQVRRLCTIVPPLLQVDGKDQFILNFKRQSIDFDDVCPICFERLLIKNRKLVTCFYSCGKSMHKNCMNEWKHVKGKSTYCPLCQAHWINPTAAEKAVLDYYERRSQPIDEHEKYFLCC